MRRVLPFLVAPLLLLTAACGGGDDSDKGGDFDSVKVTGKVGEKPTVKDVKGVKVTKVTDKVVDSGDGATIAKGDLVNLEYAIYGAKDGKELGNTYDTEGATPTEMNSDSDKVLATAFEGQKFGSRVLIGARYQDLYGDQAPAKQKNETVLIVADALSKWDAPKANGTIDDVAVSGKAGKEPKVSLSKKPLYVAKTQSKALIKGKGAPIKENDNVTVRYVGVDGRDGKTFDSSYSRGDTVDFQLTRGQMIEGFVSGLVGQRMGSRVLVTMPYNDGYGTNGSPQAGIQAGDTLVFVVDLVKKAAPQSEATPAPSAATPSQ